MTWHLINTAVTKKNCVEALNELYNITIIIIKHICRAHFRRMPQMC